MREGEREGVKQETEGLKERFISRNCVSGADGI